jgi:hypothetical protein
MLAPSQQKDKKNQPNREKRKKSPVDPGRHFPVPYFINILIAHKPQSAQN